MMIRLYLFFLILQNTYAINTQAEGFQVPASGALTVNVHSDCHTVNNNLASDLFVPTRSAGEWTIFQSNLPSNVTLSTCTSGTYTGSFAYGGYNWYMAQALETCDGRCATLGGCVAAGFGAVSSITICENIIEGIIGSSVTWTIAPTDSSDTNFTGMGCTFYENNAKSPSQLGAYRFTDGAASCSISNANPAYRRICPCSI